MNKSLPLLLFIVLSAAAPTLQAATPPFVQIINLAQLADTCQPGGNTPRIQVNMNVPRGVQYSYTVSYIDTATTFTYGSPTTYFPINVPLYYGPNESGPVVNAAAQFNVGTLALWYQPTEDPYFAQRVPDHTQMNISIYTYVPNDGSDPFTSGSNPSTASVTWDCTTGQVMAFSNSGNAAGAASLSNVVKTQAVEFYNATLDHFFVTVSDAEISALDSGRTAGWTRTGQSFGAFVGSVEGASPVCRFYIPPSSGDSHFYSASDAECSAVGARFPGFTLESPAVFYVALPDPVSGACPETTQPVYRLWNGRADSNHRYTTDAATRAQMLSKGYVAEGYGTDGVGMCAPL